MSTITFQLPDQPDAIARMRGSGTVAYCFSDTLYGQVRVKFVEGRTVLDLQSDSPMIVESVSPTHIQIRLGER